MSNSRNTQAAEPLLTSAEVSALLGISRATLQRRIADGTLKPVPKSGIHKGGAHQFTRASIAPYLPEGGDTS
jgi:predicted DNA-binding transcriptional regulator AlpA